MLGRSKVNVRWSGLRHASWLVLAILLCAARQSGLTAPPTTAPALKAGNARVVFVGDSITGLSRNYATGFAHQIEWALKETYSRCAPDLVALGGSGQGVASWRDVEKRAGQEEFFLDVPKIGVKAALDRPAHVLVIMLGMNDVLAPYAADEPASLDRWTDDYRALIAALKRRVRPEVLALATITPCTEDPASPKNRMIDRLNRRVAMLADQCGCRLLRTGESVYEVLRQGRRLRPDFHVTYDFVHPNEAGHLGIAIAMLRGLGETAAAQCLADRRLAAVLQKAADPAPSLSHEWTPLPATFQSDRQGFRVRYWWNATVAANGSLRVRLAGPGWEVQPEHCEAPEGEFLASGVPERRVNLLKLEANDGRHTRQQDVKIPAPWLVAAKMVQPMWSNMQFDASRARTPIDVAITRGEDFRAARTNLGNGGTLSWQRHFPRVDYTGLDAPGSVDFAATTHAQSFEGGYGARWIYSPRERPVHVVLGVEAFAGVLHLAVSLNGQEVYAGHITTEPDKRKRVAARLRQGWNTLVFKANHCTWQWQCAVDLAAVGQDTLDDLRYSTVAQPSSR